MNNEISKMLIKYPHLNPSTSRNALKEVIQEVTLHTLSTTDFFSHAAFYGGSALRIFHNLDRFSEDMDFSLKNKDLSFSLLDYLPAIEKGLASFGFEIATSHKEKQTDSNIQSEFLKGNTLVHLVKIFDLSAPISGVHNNELLKIKIEIDINPPSGTSYEQKFRLLPVPFSVLLYDKPSLFAGKLHALLCRNWKSREKGRDFYDYVWYLGERIPVNINHLKERMIQTGHWVRGNTLDLQKVKELLYNRFEMIDYDRVKQDVVPFITNPLALDIWSKEFFIAITKENLTSE